MNKFINILLLLILLPVILLAIIIGFDIPLEFLKVTGAFIPYKLEIFCSLGAFILIIGARRSIKRWMGLRMVNQVSRFQWNAPMAPNRYKQSVLYLMLESLLHLVMAYALFSLTPFTWPVVVILSVLAMDHLFFAFLGSQKKLFRVGITSKAILVADRDLKAVYFTGLRKVSKHQQSLFFDYVKDFQVAFPSDCISENDKETFKTILAKNLDRDSVYFTESFKNF